MLNEFKDKVSRRVSRITIVKITNALKSQDVIKTDKSKLYCQNDIEVNMEMAKATLRNGSIAYQDFPSMLLLKCNFKLTF